jgi:hypothetical protein
MLDLFVITRDHVERRVLHQFRTEPASRGRERGGEHERRAFVRSALEAARRASASARSAASRTIALLPGRRATEPC